MTFELLALPNEIVHNILAIVRHDGIEGLAALRLCSKQCKTHADQQFYHTVAFRSHNDDPSQRLYCERGDMCCEAHGRETRGARYVPEAIEQFLAAKEEVTSRVRHLIIGPWRLGLHAGVHNVFKDTEASFSSKNLARIVSKCKDLRDLSWDMSVEMSSEVLELLRTQHPNCRLHIAWRSALNESTDRTLFTLPQLTHVNLMIMGGTGSSDLPELTRLLRDNKKIESFSVTRAGENCSHAPRGWLIGWGKPLPNDQSINFRTGLTFPDLKYLRLGGWFLNSSSYVDSWVQATNWAGLRSLDMGLYTSHHLMRELRGKTPLLEHLKLPIDMARDADSASFPDNSLFTSCLVDFIADAPSLVKLTCRIRHSQKTWDLFWHILPRHIGARLRDLEITYGEYINSTHWTEERLQGLVAKAPHLESLGLQLEVDRNEKRQTMSWPTASQSVLELSHLRRLHLAVPMYEMDSAFSTKFNVGSSQANVKVNIEGAEKLIKTVFDEFSNRPNSLNLQYLDVVFFGRGWKAGTRNWRFIAERDNFSGCDGPPCTIKTIVLGSEKYCDDRFD